jgi:hypothetical protein
MDVDLESSKLCGNDDGHRRSDPEKVAGEVASGGDAKRQREGNNHPDSAIGISMDDGGEEAEEEEEEEEDGDEAVCRGWEVHRKKWRLMMAGQGATWSFDAESTYSLMIPLARRSSSYSSFFMVNEPV